MPTAPAPIVVWFRRDLRLADNPALAFACESGAPVIAIYVLDDETSPKWRIGGASRWWLHHSLAALTKALARHKVQLVLRRGRPGLVIPQFTAEIGATAVYWNRCYGPGEVAGARAVKAALRDRGVEAESFNGTRLVEPWTLITGSGAPYRVFTPFWRALQAHRSIDRPSPAPDRIAAHRLRAASDRLDDWALLPTGPDWSAGLAAHWTPGESGAQARLADFADGPAADYAAMRDRPDHAGTSMLSPHLAWGEIGPRQAWHQVAMTLLQDQPDAVTSFRRELAWRDFCANLLFHFDHIPDQPLRPEFESFPWVEDEAALSAWQQGRTGYPIVDAGMRQLWHTGWMHNRVRMVVASLLVKDLLLPWQQGESWFWDTLVDADLANNAANWQWVAGCGADAAPFFRIFNPVTQGRKFDPDGAYVRRWVPELARLPAGVIHAPWTASELALSDAGVRLGSGYPRPIVDHGMARKRALAAFQTIKAGSA